MSTAALDVQITCEATIPIEMQTCGIDGCERGGFTEPRYLANHRRSHDRVACPNGCGKTMAPHATGSHKKVCPKGQPARDKAAQLQRTQAAIGTVHARLRRLLPETGDAMLARVLKILVDAPKRDGLLIVITDDDGPWLVRPEQLAHAVQHSRAVCLVLATERIVMEGLLEDLRSGPPSRLEQDARKVG